MVREKRKLTLIEVIKLAEVVRHLQRVSKSSIAMTSISSDVDVPAALLASRKAIAEDG